MFLALDLSNLDYASSHYIIRELDREQKTVANYEKSLQLHLSLHTLDNLLKICQNYTLCLLLHQLIKLMMTYVDNGQYKMLNLVDLSRRYYTLYFANSILPNWLCLPSCMLQSDQPETTKTQWFDTPARYSRSKGIVLQKYLDKWIGW